LRLARSLDQCHSLIGNHELVSLRGRFEREGGKSPDCAPRYAWTDELSESDVEWICRLPFTIALPAHDVIVVHAGLVPGIPLEHQAPEDMTTMRDLVRGDDMSYRASYKSELGAVAWADEWPSRPHVYFGHDAKRGLQLAKYATGLDTGCVYGGALSAAILERGRTVQIVQVQAKRQYAPKRGAGDDLEGAGVLFHGFEQRIRIPSRTPVCLCDHLRRPLCCSSALAPYLR